MYLFELLGNNRPVWWLLKWKFHKHGNSWKFSSYVLFCIKTRIVKLKISQILLGQEWICYDYVHNWILITVIYPSLYFKNFEFSITFIFEYVICYFYISVTLNYWQYGKFLVQHDSTIGQGGFHPVLGAVFRSAGWFYSSKICKPFAIKVKRSSFRLSYQRSFRYLV